MFDNHYAYLCPLFYGPKYLPGAMAQYVVLFTAETLINLDLRCGYCLTRGKSPIQWSKEIVYSKSYYNAPWRY